MSNLHTMTSTQISTRLSELLLVLLTSALMFYVKLQQQLCSKHDVWHNFQDEKYFKKKKLEFRCSRSVNFICFKLKNAVMASEIGSLVWTLKVKCILGRIELKVGWRDRVISWLYGILKARARRALPGSASGIGLTKYSHTTKQSTKSMHL